MCEEQKTAPETLLNEGSSSWRAHRGSHVSLTPSHLHPIGGRKWQAPPVSGVMNAGKERQQARTDAINKRLAVSHRSSQASN